MNCHMEDSNSIELDILILSGCKLLAEGSAQAAQLAFENVLKFRDNPRTIDICLLYLQSLIAKRHWSVNVLKNNSEKGAEHIKFVRENLIDGFDDRQRQKWNDLVHEFNWEFRVYAKDSERRLMDRFFHPDEKFKKLEDKYSL